MRWPDALGTVKRIRGVAAGDSMVGRSQSSVTPGTPYGQNEAGKWA